MSRTTAILVVLLVAGAAYSSSASAANNTLQEVNAGGDAHLDAFIDTALRQVLAALVQPQSLLQHVKEAARDDMQSKPELLAGASDCELALGQFVNGLLHLETWALKMVDSSSKLVTGILYGNLADLGNFDECLEAGPGGSTPDETEDGAGFSGRYALVALDLQAAVKPSPQQERSRLYQTLAGMSHRSLLQRYTEDSNETQYSTLATVRMAVCVPSTCQAPVVQAALRSVLRPINVLAGAAGYHIDGRLPEEYTTVAGPWRKTTPADWGVLVLLLVLVLLMIVGTILDVALRDDAAKTRANMGMLLAFSVWTNGRKLLSIPPPSDSNFTCINGIRFLSALWVILGHRYRYALDVPFTNLITIPKRISDASVMVIANAPLSVDTFFLVGGLVNSYAFMRSVQGRRSFAVVMYYVHRYVRLTPAFALMVAITATWLSLLSTGPIWYQVVGHSSKSCSDNWWTSLLYVANYANPGEQCMMQAWYLMVDMQLHWLSPLILVPLWKWRRIGLGWLAIVILGSCAVPFAVTYVNEFRSPVSTDIRPEAQRFFMERMYYPTHTRVTSYACGTLAGFFLYLVKTGEIKRGISHFEVVVGWVLSTVLCLVVVFGAQPLFDTEHHAYNKWESSIYIGFFRLGWSAGIAWVVFACIFGHGGPVNAVLSWGPFNVLGRLTYGIYLTHAAVQIVDVGTMRSAEYYSDFRMVEKMFSDSIFATILGAALSLSMESPIMAIERALRSSPKGRRPRPPKGNVGGGGGGAVDASAPPNGIENAGFVADDGKGTDPLAFGVNPGKSSEATDGATGGALFATEPVKAPFESV